MSRASIVGLLTIAAAVSAIVLANRCRRDDQGTARSTLTSHCGDFVSFTFGCGIGRPAPDPTVDIATQQNNELVIWHAVSDRCRRGQPPYDEGLILCFLHAAGDCARYRTCAAAVVAARHAADPRPRPNPADSAPP